MHTVTRFRDHSKNFPINCLCTDIRYVQIKMFIYAVRTPHIINTERLNLNGHGKDMLHGILIFEMF